MSRKVILYIAMSLDGYIADENLGIEWLEPFNKTGFDYGFKDFYESIDTILIGNNTYEQIKEFDEWYYEDKTCFVFSKQEKEDEAHVQFVNDDLKDFISKLHSVDGKDIWLMGGSILANEFITAGLVDEMMITVLPVLLGAGVPLFTTATDHDLKLLDQKVYGDSVLLHYKNN